MSSLDLETVTKRARDVARGVVADEAEAVDQQGKWPEAGIRAMQASGLAALVAPVSCGGLGHGLLAVAQVCEIIGHECGSTGLCFGMHCVGTAVIAAKATQDQQARYLQPISAGQHITTLSLSEPGSGAHFYIPETQLASASPETYRVNGTKTFVTSGGHADSYVVSTTAAEADAPPGTFSTVVIPLGAAGISWGGPWEGMGMRGNASRTMELKDVIVPRSDLLGEEGDQIWYVFNVVAPYFLVAMAGTYLGIANAALDAAREHLSRRRYSVAGPGPGSQSVIQHRLGALYGQIERARRLIYYAAEQGDHRDEAALPAVLAAKAEVADCVVNVVNEAMTLSGGIAYRENSRMERMLRDARAAHIMAPTTDMLRTWIGRLLLGQPLLGD